ncbi:cyanophycin synthetase [Clostridium celatum]|uniref:Cyanophycin synthetase n=1 Tax=Clostridium celatum DSM 1785 TaxID=545697 RepID=L1QIX5_9CLOT|nr:cyanophycin synthetase [Clostridium celatum]EKY27640.1 cyanophycin synthase [Clostridium celatum DSM 1785]
MKIIDSTVYEGRNIHSHKKCIELVVNLEGYSEIPSKDIKNFNEQLIEMIPELKTHRCGIDEEGGFVKRLKEGTYLAHICEHMTLAIQNILGIDVAYGKAREIKGDLYIIVYQYEYDRVGVESARLAVDIINALIKNNNINFKERIVILKDILKKEMIGPSTLEICNTAKQIGLPVLKIGNSGFYQIGYGKQGKIIEASISNNTSCVSADISCDKLITKELLRIQNLPIAYGEKVFNVIQLLKCAEDIGYPVVLKPQFGSKGKGIILKIKNEKELVRAYQKLSNEYEDLILEEYCEGEDYRVCVVNYEVVAVSKRIPPYIKGNGKMTVKELIEKINEDQLRGEDHEKPLTKIKIDEEVKECIYEEGYLFESILEDKKVLYLRRNANLSTGGIAIDCTDDISEENKELCIRAAKAIGLDICGVDICTKDIRKPLKENGVILEVNTAPGLRMHLYPKEGKYRNIGLNIVNMMYNNNPINIPVVSITGTNGKTTTTRIINSTLSRMGYCVGMTSTDGIYINGKCIDKRDDTGADSAKCVLMNRDVDIAVLETARGGIIKKGLAYDLADVAVITNITEDHLGVDNIEDMEDLCKVKSLVAEAVKKDGYVVINADDEYSKKIINRITSNIIYYSLDKNNELIIKNIKEGKIAVYIKDNYLVVNNLGREYRVIKVKDIPITLKGSLKFNIENSMAACAALVGLKVDYSMIKIGLLNFKLNSVENSGRFNMYDYNGINVILDYGHNIEGYRSVLSSLKNIANNKVIGVIGVPGDRSDYVAKSIGRISSEFLDKIIIKEDKDKRGRKNGEVAQLIKEGILSNNKNIPFKVILDEVEALKEAINQSDSGDTIIVFFEKINRLIEVLENEKSNNEKLGNVVNSN